MLDSTPASTTDRARRYHRWQFLLSVIGFLLAGAYLAALLLTGISVRLREALEALGLSWSLQPPLALLALGLPHRAPTLPSPAVSALCLSPRSVTLTPPRAR